MLADFQKVLQQTIESGAISCYEIPWSSNGSSQYLSSYKTAVIPTGAIPKTVAHFWLLRTTHFDSTPFTSVLSEGETERVNQLKSTRERSERSKARIFLRLVLAQYLQVLPGEIEFLYGPEGKPKVVENDLSFNTSHSDGFVAIVVSGTESVGVDVEHTRLPEIAFVSIAGRFFQVKEVDALLNSPSLERSKAFQKMWTLKEAWVKTMGLGITSVFQTPCITKVPNETDKEIVSFIQYGELQGFQFQLENATCTALSTIAISQEESSLREL